MTILLKKLKNCCTKSLFIVATVVLAALGIFFGLLLRVLSKTKWTLRECMYISFAGDLYLRMLSGLGVPLIASSVVAAFGKMEIGHSCKMTAWTIGYYLVTSTISVTVGLFFTLLIKPGSSDLEEVKSSTVERTSITADMYLDLLR